MSELEEKFVKYWAEKRKHGKWRYALKHGVFFFAWPVFVLSEVFKYFFYSDYMITATRILGGFIIWSVLGFFAFGLLQWHSMEKRFRKSTHATGNTDGTSSQA